MKLVERGFIGNPDLFVYRDSFFASSTVDALHDDIASSGDRKREFRFGEIPPELHFISDTVQYAREQTQVAFNTIILKEYRPGEPSGAYDWHKDPNRFLSGPLGICTLNGLAKLSLRAEDGFIATIQTPVNRLVLANPQLSHKASPPLNKSGKRSFLFMGVSH